MDCDLVAAIETAPKQVLVDIVKLAQKQGRQGSNGGWKDFLNVYDRKLGNSLSDPARRSHEALVSFLKSLTDKEHLQFIANFLQCHSNLEVLAQIKKEIPNNESPEQRLVHLTLEHPLYLSKYAFPSYNEDWVVTKVKKKSTLSSETMLAVDCEMVLCEDGTTAVVRVCIVDRDLQVKLDKLVNPGKTVADYRSDITGVTEEDLKNISCSLKDIQKSMKKLLKKGVILVGHSLYNDLESLKIDHKRVVDTSFIFRTSTKRTPSLSSLCKSVLEYQLREEGAPHNCLDDACAAMKLVLAKIDRGVDNDFPLIEEAVKDVTGTEMAKLLLHGIPINVSPEELHGIFSEKFTIEFKPPKKAEGSQYAVFAIFGNPEEAQRAFDNISGILKKDKSSLPQKLINFQLANGGATKFYVRKMANPDNVTEVLGKKRPIQGEEDLSYAKKLKTDQCCNHLEQIERLNKELGGKDSNLEEIERLNKELIDKETKCGDLMKEIELLKKDIIMKDFHLSTQDKIIADLKNKLKDAKMVSKRG